MFNIPGNLKEADDFADYSDPQHYWNILNLLPAAIYTCDADGHVTGFNEAAVLLWGRRPVIGKDLWCGSWKIYRPDGSPLPLQDCPMALSLKEGKPLTGKEIIVERPNGDRFHVLANPQPIFDESGVLTGAINMLVDVTTHTQAQKRSEGMLKTMEALKRSEDRYHRMISEVQDYAIILLSRDGIIENWNKGAEKIKGYREQEIIGKSFRIFYTPEDRQNLLPETLIQEALQRGTANHHGWRVRKDGSRFWGSVTITTLHDSEGEVIGFSKVTRDLTERKIAEEKLITTTLQLEKNNRELEKKNAELSSFAYISSHDLQEPLRKIQTFSDRILELEFANLSEKGKDYFRRMQMGAFRMQNLIRDILAYSRTNTSDKIFELTDLNALLAQSKLELEEVILEKKAVIENPTLPVIKVIPFQIQQLFTNLLSNALKFSRNQVPPQIVITTDIIESDILQPVALDFAKRCYHIAIRDNGIGFEPIYESRIFEIFQRLHGHLDYEGTGIGLAICKKIVENHHGMIRAEGRVNEGATFHIYLPAEINSPPYPS